MASIDCRAPSGKEDSEICLRCGLHGKKVKNITVRSLVHENLVPEVGGADYTACSTPDCSLVYFSRDTGRHFTKEDVKVRVWFKETEDPIPVCYCQNVTERDILDEILLKGCPPSVSEVQKRTGVGRGGECLTKKVVESKSDCERIIIRVASLRAGISQVGRIVLDDHIKTRVTDCVQKGQGPQALSKLANAIDRLLK